MQGQACSPEHLLSQLRWRYATKVFDPSRKIDDALWAALEESLILTPTSYGMQPYRFVVVTDPGVKAQLVSFSWNQRQPAGCSHFVVFAAREQNTEADVDHYLARIAEVRGGTTADLAGFRKLLVGDVVTGERGRIAHEWATRQVYIALGNFMTAAAMLGVDTCPMEGINPPRYDELLGLSPLGYRTVVACAAGYRAADCKYATMPKVRFPASELVIRV